MIHCSPVDIFDIFVISHKMNGGVAGRGPTVPWVPFGSHNASHWPWKSMVNYGKRLYLSNCFGGCTWMIRMIHDTNPKNIPKTCGTWVWVESLRRRRPETLFLSVQIYFRINPKWLMARLEQQNFIRTSQELSGLQTPVLINT